MAHGGSMELDNYMIDYIPYKSDIKDEDSQTLVFLKDRKVFYDESRKKKFKRRIVEWVQTNLAEKRDTKVVFTIAPGHSSDSDGSGNFLYGILGKVIEENSNINDERKILYRTKDVPKSATTGIRDQRQHEETISVRNPKMIKDEVVFLFDDIWTSGSTLRACANLLKEKGAKEVKLFAVGKTKNIL